MNGCSCPQRMKFDERKRMHIPVGIGDGTSADGKFSHGVLTLVRMVQLYLVWHFSLPASSSLPLA